MLNRQAKVTLLGLLKGFFKAKHCVLNLVLTICSFRSGFLDPQFLSGINSARLKLVPGLNILNRAAILTGNFTQVVTRFDCRCCVGALCFYGCVDLEFLSRIDAVGVADFIPPLQVLRRDLVFVGD